MKQIKTVILPADASDLFDNRVNQLLLSGWQLINRKVVNAKSEPNEVGSTATIQALYAELEKG